MGLSRQNIFTIILAVVLIAVAYFWYSSVLLDQEAPSARTATASREFLTLLALLEKIKIDPEFFQSPAFSELRSPVVLPPLPASRGRVNPFR